MRITLNLHIQSGPDNSFPLDKMAAILADAISKRIFLNEKLRILIEISLKYVLKGPIDNNPALVQIMAWQILSRLRADLRENPTKQWASHDALIQSAGSISNRARYHSDANIALGPILKMYIPRQIRIFNALKSDGYSTGNAPPSGNNEQYKLAHQLCQGVDAIYNF